MKCGSESALAPRITLAEMLGGLIHQDAGIDCQSSERTEDTKSVVGSHSELMGEA